MSSKRQSTAPPPPKPPAAISSSVTIADNASVTGTYLISIGSLTVVHPRTKLTTLYGPLTVGKNCIISERCNIGLQSAGGEGIVVGEGVAIGDGVVIEVGAVVEGKEIGDGCIVEVGAKIGKGAVVGKVCFFLLLRMVSWEVSGANSDGSIARLVRYVKSRKARRYPISRSSTEMDYEDSIGPGSRTRR